jgi:stearoyl-CoA desaturase (Delta-9 desaturase)
MNDVSVMPAAEATTTRGKAPVTVRIAAFLVIVLPLLGVVAAPFLVWGWGFGWLDLSLLVGMYLLSAIGITVGFHRLFVHRSFETYMWVKFILAALGSMAVVGSILNWVAQHRRHHQHSDTPDDPHTPHHHGEGVMGVLRGFWSSHVGWFFKADPPGLERYVKDLTASPTMRIASATTLKQPSMRRSFCPI